MNLKRLFLSSVIVALGASGAQLMADGNVPAFPGAEGFARYTTTGGRGGSVVHVTNLNDSGEGSFRWALSQSGPKTIVFDVSGYIDLKSDLNISSNTTIAGQTAPGDGITLRYYTVKFTGCDNVICRYIRFRRSQIKDVNDGADATWGRQHKNIILDHCSFSWSIDEVASFYDNKNFTMQWCTLGEGLNEPGHSKGAHSYGGIWGGKGASFHHNYLTHIQNRAPRFNGARYGWNGGNDETYKNPMQAERVDFRNCVMYNWGNGNGCYGGPGGGYINMVNNYYKAGPGTVNKTRVTQISVANKSNADSSHPEYYGYTSRYYINGNYVSAAAADKRENYDWTGVSYDGGLYSIAGEKYIPDSLHMYGENVEYASYELITSSRGSKDTTYVDCVRLKLDEPVAAGDVTTHTAQTAFDKVLAYAGASLRRDAVDARYMEEAATGTTTYTGEVSKRQGIIDLVNDPAKDPSEIAYYENHANYPDLPVVTRDAAYDTDGDGMPDEWELANGLNPNDAADAKLVTLDGTQGWYTNLEVYINGLVEHITKAQNADCISGVDEYYPAQQFTSGIAQVNPYGYQVSSIEYFALDGKPLAEPSMGICIRRINFTDGHSEVTKVLRR